MATDTHLEYAIHIAFSQQQWLHERASILGLSWCIHIRCILLYLYVLWSEAWLVLVTSSSVSPVFCLSAFLLPVCLLVFRCVVIKRWWGGGMDIGVINTGNRMHQRTDGLSTGQLMLSPSSLTEWHWNEVSLVVAFGTGSAHGTCRPPGDLQL